MSVPNSHTTRSRGSRAIVAALTAGVAALALAGCTPASSSQSGDSGDTSSKSFTVYWNPGHAYDAYKKIIDDFGTTHNLKMNWQQYQWPDMTTKLAADFKSGQTPDLVEAVSPTTAVQYGVAGDAMPLNKFLAKDGKSIGFPADYVDSTVHASQYDGKTYAIPLHSTANGIIFYNKKLLKAAGFDAAPSTWTQFEKVAKATTKDGVYGYALNQDASYAAPWLAQADVTPSDASKGKFLEPSGDATQTMEMLQQFVSDGVSPAPVTSSDYSGPQKLFSAGRAAMFISGPWDIQPVEQGSGDIDWGIAPPLKGEMQASSAAGTGMMIPTKSKRPELAWDLLKQLTSLKTELAATKESGMSMPRKSWADTDLVKNDPRLTVVAEAVSVAQEPDVQLSADGHATEVSNLFSTAYQKIVIQGANAASTLEDYRNQAKKVAK